MSQRPIRADLSHSTKAGASRLIPAALLVALVAVVASTAQPSPAAPVPGALPARLEYELAYDDGSGGALEEVTFRLDLSSWDNWRQEITCCGPMTGYVQEQRPDGSVWSGYEEWADGLMLTHEGRRGEGSVPMPDFSQGRPYTREEIGELPGVAFDDRAAIEWAERLGLDPGTVVAYRTSGSAAEGIHGAVETLSVVDSTRRIPIHIEELEGGILTRSLTLTRVEPTS